MTPEEYLDALLTLPSIEDDLLPQVSRDGRWVAWTWFQVGKASEVFAAPSNSSAAPIRLTDTRDTSYLVSWTPDSLAVIVAQDEDGNEHDQLLTGEKTTSPFYQIQHRTNFFTELNRGFCPMQLFIIAFVIGYHKL